MLRCYDASVDVIRSDEQRVRSYLPDIVPISPAVAQQTLLYHWRKVGEVDIPAIQKLADVFYTERLMKNPVDAKGLVGTWKDLQGNRREWLYSHPYQTRASSNGWAAFHIFRYSFDVAMVKFSLSSSQRCGNQPVCVIAGLSVWMRHGENQ